MATAHPSVVDAPLLDRLLGGPHGRVVNAVVEPHGTGQLATTLRARIAWSTDDPSLPTQVVVKVAASDTGTRDAQRRAVTYRREVEFYRHLAGRILTATPRCLHCDFDDSTGSFTLVMEEAHGAPGNQLLGCTAAEASAIVEAAAGLHAPFWNRSDLLLPHTWLSPNDTSAHRYRSDRYRACVPGFIERYRDRLSPEVLDTARWLDDHLFTALTAHRCPPCLVHNDFRLDNMLFSRGANGPLVTVVDWQTVGIGSGPVDLAYALGSGLGTPLRVAVEHSLVDEYIGALEQHGATVVAEDVRRDYRLGSIDGLVMAVIASQVVMRTPRGDEMFAVMAERHAHQMHDLAVQELVN